MAIEPYDSPLTGDQVVELADDEVLMPGLVDTHVHINKPGAVTASMSTGPLRPAAQQGVGMTGPEVLAAFPPR